MPVVGHLPVADTAYLKRRFGKDRSGASYYVRIVVPNKLRDKLRRKTIERSLNTTDPSRYQHEPKKEKIRHKYI